MSNDARLSPLFTWRSAVSSEDGPESPTTRHVLLALSLYMSQKGDSCFPSTRTLAKETGLTRRTVEEHLRKADREGWIDKSEPERGDDGTYEPAEYEATIPGESLSPGPGEADTEPGESDASDQGKQVPHNTSTENTSDVNTSDQPAGARAKLRSYLNGHGEVVGVFHERFGPSSPTWAQAVRGQYIGGVREDIWRGIPEGERPKILAATLWSFIGDADEYDNRLFEAYLKRRIEGWQERDRAEKMPEGVTAGDAQILDFRERIEHVDLGA